MLYITWVRGFCCGDALFCFVSLTDNNPALGVAPPLPNEVSVTPTAPPGLISVWRSAQLNGIFLFLGKGGEEKYLIIKQAPSENGNKMLMANVS